jgi:proline iminopeptidase
MPVRIHSWSIMSSGGMINRRDLLATGPVSAIMSVTNSGTMTVAGELTPSDKTALNAANTAVETTSPDGLNPVNLRTAGIRMIPVVGGKYKVWTKCIGRGPVWMVDKHADGRD